MDRKDLKYYQLIGKATAAVAGADSPEEALRMSLQTFIDGEMVDYAVSWYRDPEQNVLRPSYWICPVDLTAQVCLPGEGCAGRVFLTQKTETIYDFARTPDPEAAEIFRDIRIGSIVCIPFSISGKEFGCIELIRSSEHGCINEDEAGICDILALMIEMSITDKYPQIEEKRKDLLLRARNIHKYYQSGDGVSHVIKGFNLDVFKGEILCFLGVSGCGKSTMLNILGGLLEFEDGSLLFEGWEMKDAKKEELSEYRRKNIGIVFQSYNLMPNLNARHNIELIGELVENPLDALELLEALGLREKADRYPAMLSGGEQQRVAIARAMVKKPKLILADEPTAALDYHTSIEVLEAFQKAREYGTAIVLVTHNEEISKIADRVIRFRDGKMYETTVNYRPKKPSELLW